MVTSVVKGFIIGCSKIIVAMVEAKGTNTLWLKNIDVVRPTKKW